MAGAVVIALVMLLIGPVAVFVGGAVWSALFGWLTGNEAEQRAAGSADGAAG